MSGYKIISPVLEREIKENLNPMLLMHTENTMEKAVELAKKYGEDPEKARFAAMIHDRFRDIEDDELNKLIDKYGIDPSYKDNNALGHSKVAAEYLKNKYGIEDEEILNSVRFHTTGRCNMCPLEKIVFLADATEKGRNYPGVELIRKETEKGLDEGLIAACRNTIDHLESLNKEIEPDTAEALAETEKKVKGE